MIDPAAVVTEIVSLHEFFEAWLNGDESADFGRVEAALAPDFTFLPPNGEIVSRADLLDGLRDGFGQRAIRIRIAEATVRWSDAAACVATYEEWHEHADYATARRSSVLFTDDPDAPGGLTWQLVHESWLRPPPGQSAS